MNGFSSKLTRVLCWTRMQAESGQEISSIIARKELERRVGGGLFFWGIGNAPSRSIGSLVSSGNNTDVVFSLMKGRPKVRDVSPSGVLVWRTYFDAHGAEHPVPSHALVTSRMESGSEMKKNHYALICRSKEELRLDDYGPFDPSAYRNVGDTGGRVSHSQVTALVVRTHTESNESDYRINLRARLAGSYWVKLGRPCALGQAARAALALASARAKELDGNDWIEMVSNITSTAPSGVPGQVYLF